MRKYGTDHKDKLIGELESIKALVPSTPYSRTIEPIEIDEEHKFFKIACWETAKEAHDQVYKVTKKARVVKNIITEFYGGVDTNATEILAAATKVSDMLIEANSVLQRMDAALCSVGDYQGRKVTSSILEEAGVNKDEFSKLSTEAWNKICDIEIANNAITETAVNVFVNRITSMLSKGETLSKEDANRVDPMYSVYLKRFTGSKDVKLPTDDRKKIKQLYQYYADKRFDGALDSHLLKPQNLQNCIDAYELLNPAHKEIFDNFLSDVYSMPEYLEGDETVLKHLRCIKFDVYTASNDYRKIIFNHLPELELHILEPDPVNIAHYSPGSDKKKPSINLILKKDPYHMDKPDCAFCHEFGHAIDDMSFEDYTEKDGRVRNNISIMFRDTLISDFRTHLETTISDLDITRIEEAKKTDKDATPLSTKQVNEIIDFIISKENVNVSVDGQSDYYKTLLPKTWSDEQIEIFSDVRDYYGYSEYVYDENSEDVYVKKDKGNKITIFTSILDDIVGGITNNQLGGLGGHSLDQTRLLLSGDAISSKNVTSADALYEALKEYDYWYYSEDKKYEVKINDHFATEFFAENFNCHLKGMDMTDTREIFGNSVDLFEQTLEDIFKNNT